VDSDRARAAAVVRTALNLVRLFAILSAPLVPQASGRVLDALEASPDERRWPADVAREIQTLRPGRRIQPVDLLFRRITEDEMTMWTARFAGQESPPVGSPG
jgi:methionyl-tRNA synthetase